MTLKKPTIMLRNDHVHIGKHFSVSFQRTLRIPDDGGTYSLPPGLGTFPVCRVEDYADRVPAAWENLGGFFIPMYQREALWLSFQGADWSPNAVQVATGKVNAITGKKLSRRLSKSKQNYVVCPDQPWLDGINAGKGYIRQFVAMPLGMGYTVESQVTGKEEFGGMQIILYEPKPGRFPKRPPKLRYGRDLIEYSMCCCSPSADMGLAAGGKMKQDIYPDAYGIDTWDQDNYAEVYVHIVNSMLYHEITGMLPPSTPITARTYTEYGLPWFDLYNEGKGDVAASKILSKVKTVKQMDKKKGFKSQQDDSSITVPANQIKKLKHKHV
jgi:hypothetical protein